MINEKEITLMIVRYSFSLQHRIYQLKEDFLKYLFFLFLRIMTPWLYIMLIIKDHLEYQRDF